MTKLSLQGKSCSVVLKDLSSFSELRQQSTSVQELDTWQETSPANVEECVSKLQSEIGKKSENLVPFKKIKSPEKNKI